MRSRGRAATHACEVTSKKMTHRWGRLRLSIVMRGVLVALPVLVVLSSCREASTELGPPRPPTESETPIESGTRLVGQRVVSADGRASALVRLFDTALDEPCDLSSYGEPEGSVRCRPRASATIVYLDDECTEPFVETARTDRAWVVAEERVRLGARLSPQPTARYRSFARGYCEAEPLPPAAPVYALAEVADPSELARGRLVVDDSDPRLSITRFVGDDGSHFVHTIVDRTSGEVCVPGTTDAGPRCRPDVGDLEDEGLLDERCERLAILDYGSTRVARVGGRDDAIYRFETGYAAPVRLGHRGAEGTCTVEELHPGRRTLHVGTPYPETDWPRVTLAEGVSSSGLVASTAVLPSGERLVPLPRIDRRALFDVDGAPCGPVWVDGVLRCLPASPFVFDVFADARCTVPAWLSVDDTPPPSTLTILEGDEPLTGLPIGAVQTVRAADTTETFGGPECVPFGLVGLVLLRGDRVDPARFPELDLEVESRAERRSE